MNFLLEFLFILVISTNFGEARKRKSTTTVKPDMNNADSMNDFALFPQPHPSPNQRYLIGAFNMKKFGLPKVANDSVMETILKITTRYDLIALTEITDRTELALQHLVQKINHVSKYRYQYVVSDRVGRSNNKEQYAIIFRPDLVRVKNHFLYNDSITDPFAREPQIVILQFRGYDKDIALVNIHVKPTEAISEIDALADVSAWIEFELKIKDIIMLGDFNADCGYVANKAWKNIRLRTMKHYQWLISDNVDTTVGKTNCAYDRIVVSGSFFNDVVIRNSAQAFKFDTAFELNEATALKVSDHYPVEFAIKPASTTPYNMRQMRLYVEDDQIINSSGMMDNVNNTIDNLSPISDETVKEEGSGTNNNSSLILDSDKNKNETTTSFQKTKNSLTKLIPKWVRNAFSSLF